MLFHRFRPLLICAVALAGLWMLAVCARTESVRVTALRGSGSAETYTVTCRLENPSERDAHLIAVVSVLASKENTEGDVDISLAEAERELLIPAKGEFPLTVVFARNWGWWPLVHPQVIVQPAD